MSDPLFHMMFGREPTEQETKRSDINMRMFAAIDAFYKEHTDAFCDLLEHLAWRELAKEPGKDWRTFFSPDYDAEKQEDGSWKKLSGYMIMVYNSNVDISGVAANSVVRQMIGWLALAGIGTHFNEVKLFDTRPPPKSITDPFEAEHAANGE